MSDNYRYLPVLCAALVAAGCYNYVPVATSPGPGHAVRAEVSDEGATQLTSQLGPGVRELEGTLLNADPQHVSILVQSYVTLRMGTMAASGEAVRLEPRHILVLKEKRLQPTRSVLLGISLAATAYLALAVFGPERRIYEDLDPEDPGQPQLRGPRPGLRVVLPGLRHVP